MQLVSASTANSAAAAPIVSTERQTRMMGIRIVFGRELGPWRRGAQTPSTGLRHPSFLWRKMPESDARSVRGALTRPAVDCSRGPAPRPLAGRLNGRGRRAGVLSPAR